MFQPGFCQFALFDPLGTQVNVLRDLRGLLIQSGHKVVVRMVKLVDVTLFGDSITQIGRKHQKTLVSSCV